MLAQRPGPELRTIRIQREFPAEIGWHVHAEAQLYSLYSGVMAVETQRGAMVMPAGRLGWIPALHEHRAQTFGAMAGWSIYLSPQLTARLPSEPCVLQKSVLIDALVERISSWQVGRIRSEADDRVVGVLMDELQSNPERSLSLSFPRDRRLISIASRLLTEPASGWKLRDWARWGGIGPRSLVRGFKLETGLTFGRWRSFARLLRALEPLAAGSPVGEVALRSGYENTSAFIAVFKSHFGMTPAAYFRDVTLERKVSAGTPAESARPAGVPRNTRAFRIRT
jgi:AraC-like DNA-binding protein